MVLGAQINGVVAAERVVVDGKVEGPIQGGEVILRSQANVVGDIHHQSLAIERGAYFYGLLGDPGRESTFEGALADKGESKQSDEVARRASLPQCAGRGYSISGYCFQSCGRSEAHSTYSANC